MTTTTETTTPATQADPSGASAPHTGLSPLNKHGAAVHHDLFAVKPDPTEERAELKRQSRILGLGFLVVFSLIIGGLSFSFNGAWRAGFGANFPQLPYVPLPSESADAADELRAAPPLFQVKNGGAQEWRATEHLDLRHDPRDDLAPSELQDLTPIHLYFNRTHVGTCYARLNQGEVPARLRRPNLEPVPVRASLPNAIEQARLFGMLPTCYPAGFGLLMGALALVAPVLLIPFYRFWMRAVTAPLGWFNTRLILGVVFYLMFTPLALVLRVRRLFTPENDALGRAPRPKDESYWKLREKKREHTHYRRLF